MRQNEKKRKMTIGSYNGASQTALESLEEVATRKKLSSVQWEKIR